jgi:hypothetical protein
VRSLASAGRDGSVAVGDATTGRGVGVDDGSDERDERLPVCQLSVSLRLSFGVC